MKIYLYNELTGEFLKESIAPLDLEKSRIAKTYVYNYPKNCTKIAPPKLNYDEQAVFKDNNWIIEKDFRNQKFYDTETNRIILVTDLGPIPDTYIPVGSEAFYNHLQKIDLNLLRNSIKTEIEKLYLQELNNKIIIDKYVFILKDFNKFKDVYIHNKDYLTSIENKIEELNLRLANTYEPELKNNLIKEQLHLYNIVDDYKIETTLKNKRNKEITVTLDFKVFETMFLEFEKAFTNIEKVKENLFNRLKFTEDEDLIIFEQRLCDKGLFVYEKTGNEEVFKVHRETS